MATRADTLARELNAQRNAFKAFLTARVGSAAEAEDLLQNGLLKAVQRAGELHDDAKLTALILPTAASRHCRPLSFPGRPQSAR